MSSLSLMYVYSLQWFSTLYLYRFPSPQFENVCNPAMTNDTTLHLIFELDNFLAIKLLPNSTWRICPRLLTLMGVSFQNQVGSSYLTEIDARQKDLHLLYTSNNPNW